MSVDQEATLSKRDRNDLFELLDLLMEEQLDGGGRQRLDRLLSDSEEARRLYISEMNRHANFVWECGVLGELQEEPTDSPLTFPSLSPFPSSLSPSFVGGPVFSYMVASVVLCLMLLGTWAYKISYDRNIFTADSRSSTTSGSLEQRQLVFVGRVTGMKDCRWSDPDAETYLGASAPLGREYALASGLMEITYQSGARVILEGPCAYKIDFSAGGFLARGKLTARIGERGEGRGERIQQIPKSPNPQSPIPYPFVVRTPTAIVTDLGTEFGVEVDENGATESHVIQGKVEVKTLNPNSGGNNHIRVEAGHAIRIEPDGDSTSVVSFAPDRFIRRLTTPPDKRAEEAYIRAVLADKPLGYWPLNEPANSRRFIDRSGNNFHGMALGKVFAGQDGPSPGKSAAVELKGNGYIDVGRRDRFAFSNGFTVEAWVWIDKPSGISGRIISAASCDGFHQSSGWAMGYSGFVDEPNAGDKEPYCNFTCYGEQFGANYHRVGTPLREWMHLAYVFASDNSGRLYRNGEPWGAFPPNVPAKIGPTWVAIGWGSNIDGEFWRGRLAHVAVYPTELSQEQIDSHYRCLHKSTETPEKK
ncbi:MAG: hypothetical protein JW959_04470 [Pirellulales bacterium]|nr:hypothetical protein [Pirellulales bacterium]